MLNLFTSANYRYFNRLTALVASFGHYHAGETVYVWNAGLTTKQCVQLRDRGVHVFRHGRESYTPDQIVCRRFLIAAGLPKPLICLDADCLIRRRIVLQECDVGLKLRDGDNPLRQVYGGCVYLNDTRGATRFMSCYRERIKHLSECWCHDQQAIRECHDMLKRVKYWRMPQRFFSRFRFHKPTIWAPRKRVGVYYRRDSRRWQIAFWGAR